MGPRPHLSVIRAAHLTGPVPYGRVRPDSVFRFMRRSKLPSRRVGWIRIRRPFRTHVAVQLCPQVLKQQYRTGRPGHGRPRGIPDSKNYILSTVKIIRSDDLYSTGLSTQSLHYTPHARGTEQSTRERVFTCMHARRAQYSSARCACVDPCVQ